MKRTHALGLILLSAPLIGGASPPDKAAKLDETIATLLPVIASADEARKPELVFRLAELYWQKAQNLKAKGMLAHDTAYVSWIQRGQTGRAPDVDDFLAESRAFTNNAHSLAKRVLETAPDYDRNDEVLFFLAQSAETLGRNAQAAEHYAMMIRRHPRSRIVPVAWLRLGEFHFAKNRLVPARRAYERAYATGKGINKRFALHKLAWCDYNAQAYSAAVEKLKRVVTAEGAADLKSEALRDLTLFFAQVDDVDGAIAYFAEHGGSNAATYTTRYAAILDKQGSWPLAVAARKKFLLRFPKHDSTPVRIALIASLLQVEHYAEITAEAAKLPKTASKTEPDGALYTVAAELHRRAAKSSRKDQRRAAAATYAAHLTLFPDREPIGEVRFFYAEMAMLLGDHALAAKSYDAVAADVRSGRFQIPAAMGAVLAHEKLGAGLVKACDRYVTLAPDAEDAAEVMYRAAQAQDEAGEHYDAKRRLLALAEAHPAHELARTGARRVTKRLLAEKRWAEAASTGRTFLDRLPKGDVTIARAVEGATYKSLQAKEAAAKSLEGTAKELALVEIAEDFAAFQKDFPKSAFADEALLSAALLSSHVGRIDRAKEHASLLAERYPRSEHAAQNYLLYAELHERTADLATAARMFAQFAASYPKHPRAPDALVNAGLYFDGLDDKKAARGAYSKYVVRHRDAPDAPHVYLRLCATHAPKRAAKCYGAFAKRWPDASKTTLVAAKGALAEALGKAGRKRQAERIRAWLVRSWPSWPQAVKNDRRARKVTATAAFAAAERRLAKMRKIDVDAGRRNVAKKLAALNDLVCAPSVMMCKSPGHYVRVIRYGDPDLAVAALTRIGDSYRDVHEALSGAREPIGLTPEQLEIYRADVHRRVVVLAGRSIEAYELAVSKAQELGVYDQWVIEATTQLHLADADRWPDRQERPVDSVDDLLESPIREAGNSTTTR